MLLALPLVAACAADVSMKPVADSPTTPIAFDQLHAGARPVVIATGGTQRVTIPDPTSVGWSGEASAGFDLVPPAGIWPNTRAPEYVVHANAATTGTFSIATDHGIASGDLASAEVDGVALVPASYALDGHSPWAIDPARPLVEIAITDHDGARLVDGSVQLAAAGATQTAWDTLALASSQTVTITADSFAPRQLAVLVAGAPDRVETTHDGDRTCYHAYAGATEIATLLPLEGTRDPDAINCAR